ncbi:hypothetical protein [Nocardioides albertanoniae]|nr:hypothetical protein [Nocardioides albertanoniae]
MNLSRPPEACFTADGTWRRRRATALMVIWSDPLSSKMSMTASA